MSDIIRRCIDIFVSITALVILSPLLLTVAGLVYFTSPGGVLYRSKRIGKDGKEFILYKFRSMVSGADKMGALNVAHTDSRVTPVGRILRTTKLDEFPQFINVLIGNMTLVGPRPDIPEYAAKLSEENRRVIYSVKPGLADWASLFAFNQYEFFAKTDNPDEYHIKFILPVRTALQCYYCRNRSLLTDWQIIILTALRILHIDLGLPVKVKDVINKNRSFSDK